MWEDGFDHPMSMDYITTRFGMRRSYNGKDYRTFHGGVDFGASEGTPIYAPAAGVVVMSKTLDIRGTTTIIDHGIGIFTGYWHQQESAVSVGQKLASGDLIGYVGNTGLSTGPHLHYEVIMNGKKIDSQKLRLPSGKILKNNERELFEIHRITTDVLIAEMISKKE